ncbi:MAG: hypothetical protein NZV14_07975 [Bryobacteraceae bacterium]|nr:hypothetical protein [Bryobacteraceae bacterium]MDW8378084.1 hypothetical protein [Bryobacterales bacterium]
MSELAQKIECFKAGSSVAEQLEAQRLEREIASAYLEWGLVGVEGLKIDGKSATPSSLVEYGPEELVEEALKAITSQLGLREEERKN